MKVMFDGIESFKETDAASMPLVYAAMGCAGSAGAETGKLTEFKSDEATLVLCMRKVHAERDRDAFEQLFRHFAPRVKSYLMKSGANAPMAEECAQEVMATVWRKAHLFDPSRATVATWIFTVARNLMIDEIRKQRRPEPEELAWGREEEPDQVDVVALRQESAQLARAVAALPEQHRVLIEKAYFGDLTHNEIAGITGLPLGTIKSRIRWAIKQLRRAMK